MKKPTIFFALALLTFSSCIKSNKEKESTQAEAVKLEQYLVSGKRLYMTYCSNCHKEEGDGLAKLYPPLYPSNYVEVNFDKTVCIIRNGMQGEIEVNGITYNQVMPPLPQLTDLEIAEITNFIYNSWGRERGFIPLDSVSNVLNNCGEVL